MFHCFRGDTRFSRQFAYTEADYICRLQGIEVLLILYQLLYGDHSTRIRQIQTGLFSVHSEQVTDLDARAYWQ